MAKQVDLTLYSITAWLLQHMVYYFCRWYFFQQKGWSVTASPQLEKVQKPVIFAVAPHMSHTDVVIVPASIPIRLLPVRWLADKKIFSGRIKSFWLKLWGAIPVERDQSGSIELDDIERILDYAMNGKCIGVFPECCLVGGRFGDPHRDLVVSAITSNIRVVPVSLSGNEGSIKPFSHNSIVQSTRISIGDPLTDAVDLLDGLTS